MSKKKSIEKANKMILGESVINESMDIIDLDLNEFLLKVEVQNVQYNPTVSDEVIIRAKAIKGPPPPEKGRYYRDPETWLNKNPNKL